MQGDGFGVGFFPPLNSIFSTRRSSRGSRRRLLLRETSGFAFVADALNSCSLENPAPAGSPSASEEGGIIKSEEKSEPERNMEVSGCEV